MQFQRALYEDVENDGDLGDGEMEESTKEYFERGDEYYKSS